MIFPLRHALQYEPDQDIGWCRTLDLAGDAEPGQAQRKSRRAKKVPYEFLLEGIGLTLTPLFSDFFFLLSLLAVVFLFV